MNSTRPRLVSWLAEWWAAQRVKNYQRAAETPAREHVVRGVTVFSGLLTMHVVRDDYHGSWLVAGGVALGVTFGVGVVGWAVAELGASFFRRGHGAAEERGGDQFMHR